MAKPRLNPPCPGWQRDLPGPNEPIDESPTILWQSPTHLDSIYMDIPRNVSTVRGLVFCCAVIAALTTAWYIFFTGWLIFILRAFDTWTTLARIGVTLLDIVTVVFGVWGTCVLYRADVSPPRDLPLRFNRVRRKVYVYGFHSVWWNPFTRWYVTTASYDWDDLRAEKWKVRGATAGGAPIIKEGVSIAVVKSGTNEVITRFDFSTAATNTTNLWAYVCSYMQHGTKRLDPGHAESRDPNDVAPYNLALRLAPKVEWPAKMDAESRTAP